VSLASRPRGGYQVQDEECVVLAGPQARQVSFFHVHSGKVRSSESVAPPAAPDRLYLVNASGLPAFRAAYDALSRMVVYNLDLGSMRAIRDREPGDLLERDGSNVASVLMNLRERARDRLTRLEAYLARIDEGLHEVNTERVGSSLRLIFTKRCGSARALGRFDAGSISDGTIHALGTLAALFQAGNGIAGHVPLVGIEEPELALHPAAAGILLDALRDASATRQVVVTSHSPDLLDDKEIDVESIRAVVMDKGVTRIGPVDHVGRGVLRERLYTPGELLRVNQLLPEPDPPKKPEEEFALFDRGGS
jgi:hypothetical protein